MLSNETPRERFCPQRSDIFCPCLYVPIGTAVTDSKVIFGESHQMCQHPFYFWLEKQRLVPEVVMEVWRMQDTSQAKQECSAFYFSSSMQICVEDWQDFTRRSHLPTLSLLSCVLGQSVASVTVEALLRNEETDGSKKHSCFLCTSEGNLTYFEIMGLGWLLPSKGIRMEDRYRSQMFKAYWTQGGADGSI